MSEQTNIAWCDSTVNFWSGCTKVSAGCANCYAEELGNRFPTFGKWGKGAPRQLHESAFKDALKYNRKPWICELCGRGFTHNGVLHDAVDKNGNYIHRYDDSRLQSSFHRRRIFSLSLGDWLDSEVPIEWLARMLDTIRQCDQVTWILCTKRPELWRERTRNALHWIQDNTPMKDVEDAWLHDWVECDKPPKNIILLTSVENQEQADKRIPELLKIPAAVAGLSCEPLLGPVDLKLKVYEVVEENSRKSFVNWIIIGGESGNNARPCNVDWIRSLVQQGKDAGVATFVKQLGSKPQEIIPDTNGADALKVAFKYKDKKGGDMAEWPEDLRVQEWPKI